MDTGKKEILLFGTTRYSNPLSESDKNKFIELSKVASLNLLTYGDKNSKYFENEVYFESIKEPKTPDKVATFDQAVLTKRLPFS